MNLEVDEKELAKLHEVGQRTRIAGLSRAGSCPEKVKRSIVSDWSIFFQNSKRDQLDVVIYSKKFCFPVTQIYAMGS